MDPQGLFCFCYAFRGIKKQLSVKHKILERMYVCISSEIYIFSCCMLNFPYSLFTLKYTKKIRFSRRRSGGRYFKKNTLGNPTWRCHSNPAENNLRNPFPGSNLRFSNLYSILSSQHNSLKIYISDSPSLTPASVSNIIP